MRFTFFAWGLLGLSFVAWAGFGFLVIQLGHERDAYAEVASHTESESVRREAAAHLRTLVQGTQGERAALEMLASASIIQVADTIEKTVSDAGATNVAISTATPDPRAPQGLSVLQIGMTADGSFAALLRAESLLEKLPIPATVEKFEISKTEKAWRLTVSLRVTLAATQ